MCSDFSSKGIKESLTQTQVFLTIVIQDQWLLFKKTNKEPSTSLARMQVILQVESLVMSFISKYCLELSLIFKSKIYMLLLSTWSNLVSILLKPFSDHVFSKESNKLTKCHLRFFQDWSWGLLYASDHQPICDGSCKISWDLWRFCSAKKVYPETVKR